MSAVLILGCGPTSEIAAAVKRIIESDTRYFCTRENLGSIGSVTIDDPIKGHGWYNKFNKQNKRSNLKLR